MYKYYFATLKHFDKLLEISNEFEIHRLSSNAKKDNVDKKQLLKNSKKYLRENLSDKHFKFFVCELENRIVGYTFFGQDEVYKDEGFLGELYVIPSERKNGIATRLMEEALKWIKNKKCVQIELGVSSSNKEAIKLYRKLGFIKQKDDFQTFLMKL